MPGEKNQLRVLMTADTIGGVWTFALDLIEALRPAGVSFGLATMGERLTPPQRRSIQALKNVELFESNYRLEWMNNPWEEVDQAGEWLLELAADFKPHLIHLNGYVHAALGWDVPVLITAHSCVFSWFDRVLGCSPPPAEWDVYHRRVSEGLAAASFVTAPSAAMLADLAHHYVDVRYKARAIYNGRSFDLFRSGSKKPIVLTAGRLWDKAKNIDVLEKAAPEVAWPIHVAGECRHPDGGETRFSNLRALGQLTPDQFAGQLSAAAIYALPAKYEPFGLSALEAGLSGCALVLSDIPSLREVWGDNALFLPPEDPACWANTLNRLAGDPVWRQVLADRAFAHSRKYAPRRMGRNYLSAYHAIVEPNVTSNENSPLLPLASFGLESWKRALSSRLHQRAQRPRP